MILSLRDVFRSALPRRNPDLLDTGERKALRWTKTGVWIIAGIIALQAVLLVAGAWRNDRQIERHMGCLLYTSPSPRDRS